MTFVFFNAADKILFSRNDAEEAEFCHEEMRLNLSFPYDPGKVIERGMRVGFRDALGDFQAFEIRKATMQEPEHYQEITAEHIAVSELTDDFFLQKDWTNVTAQAALAEALTGTLWSVGTVTASGTSSASVGNGGVWQIIRQIEKNWNVYILPRITVGPSGITGRYLDILPAGGIWRGLRFSLEKNLDQAGVTWDDSNLKTALYGLGKQSSDSPLTFSEVVWAATADHPAKPAGQTYIEDPDATAAYGRNGRPRFGYYQNSDITDPNILLEKTWETLKTVRVPDVSIDGVARNLQKLGNISEIPIRLHDTAMVEIRPTGVLLQKEVIQFTEDLLNPLNDRITIGDYIPNIIYINREHSGGGSGSGGQTNQEYRFTGDVDIFESDIRSQVALIVQEHDGDYVVNAASIVLALNESGSNVAINADKVELNGSVIVGGPSGMEGLSSAYGNFGHVYAYDESHFLDDVYMDQSLEVQSVAADYVTTDVLVVHGSSGYQTATWQQATISGVTITYLGA